MVDLFTSRSRVLMNHTFARTIQHWLMLNRMSEIYNGFSSIYIICASNTLVIWLKPGSLIVNLNKHVKQLKHGQKNISPHFSFPTSSMKSKNGQLPTRQKREARKSCKSKPQEAHVPSSPATKLTKPPYKLPSDSPQTTHSTTSKSRDLTVLLFQKRNGEVGYSSFKEPLLSQMVA